MAATNPATKKPTGAFIPVSSQYWAYATLALGSAMALFMYPHSITGSLAAKSRTTIRRNAAILPAYSFVLGLLALLGWVAIAAKTNVDNPQLVIPQLFEDQFPSWFAGVAFAAVAIGALVPAAIMSIAAANTFTRNVYKEWLRPGATPAEEARVSKLASLVVKAFALVFVLSLDQQNAINFQLLGGIWILQTFPAVVFSLYTRWFHKWALLVGWAAGMAYGTYAAYEVSSPKTSHFGGSLYNIPAIGQMGYIALTSFVLNVVVAVVVTVVLNLAKVDNGTDQTVPGDYYADADDPRVAADLAEHGGPEAGTVT
jgi:SSS family solute:Na+ symporter